MDKCKHCDKSPCYAHCQNTADGNHVPDPSSVVAADRAGRGSDWIVDVSCKNCRISGSTVIDPKTIEFE